MKIFLFVICCSFGSLSFAALHWDAAVVKRYSSAKTYRDILCESPKKEICLFYQKALGPKMSQKPATITLENPETLLLKTSAMSLRISRSETETMFTVNNHKIDLLNAFTPSELRAMIQDSVPKKSVHYSRWISAAVAEDAPFGTVDPEIVGAIEVMISQTQKFNSCESIQNFIDACIQQPWNRGLVQSVKTWDKGSLKEKQKQVKVTKTYIKKLEELSRKVEKSKVPSQDTKVQECAYYQPDILPNFDACIGGFKDQEKMLRAMNLRTEMQVSNAILKRAKEQSQKAVAMPALAAPTNKKPGDGIQ